MIVQSLTFEELNYRCKYGAVLVDGQIYVLTAPPSLDDGLYSASAARYGDIPDDDEEVPTYELVFPLPESVDGFTIDLLSNVSIYEDVYEPTNIYDVAGYIDFDFYDHA